MIPSAAVPVHSRTLARCGLALLVATATLTVAPGASAARADADECAVEAPAQRRAGPVARKRAPLPKNTLRSNAPPADAGTDTHAGSGTIRRVQMRPIPLQCVPNERIQQAHAAAARPAGPAGGHLAAPGPQTAGFGFSPRESRPA